MIVLILFHGRRCPPPSQKVSLMQNFGLDIKVELKSLMIFSRSLQNEYIDYEEKLKTDLDACLR